MKSTSCEMRIRSIITFHIGKARDGKMRYDDRKLMNLNRNTDGSSFFVPSTND